MTPTQLSTYASLCFAASFIPWPIVDEQVQTRIAKMMIGKLLEDAGVPVSPANSILAARGGSCWSGCIGLPLRLLLFPVRKLFKFAAVVMKSNKLALEFEYWLLKGLAVQVALEAGWRPGDEASLRHFHGVIESLQQELGHRPLGKGFKQLLTFGALRLLWRRAVALVRGSEQSESDMSVPSTREAALSSLASGLITEELRIALHQHLHQRGVLSESGL